MRVIIQRVIMTQVIIGGNIYSEIGKGLLVLTGIEEADNQGDIEWISRKIAGLRIFSDENQAMNLSVKDVNGGLLVVSQFTLHASTRKGNRPSFIKAAKPEYAASVYKLFIEYLSKETGIDVKTGKFGAMMQISLINDGPVTIMIDSKFRE